MGESESENKTESKGSNATDNKSESKREKVSEQDLQKIRHQIEFYFSPSNLATDRFLINLMNQNKKMAPLTNIAQFNRISSLTQDEATILEAVKSSETIEIIKVDNKNYIKCKQNSSLTLEQINKKSIYAKGLPMDSTIESVGDMFKNQGVQVVSVRLRRRKTKEFKGSAFVELSNEDEVKSIISKIIKVQDKDLILKPKIKYVEEKKTTIKEKKLKTKKRKPQKAATAGSDAKEHKDEKEEKKEKIPNVLVKLSGLAAATVREDIQAAVEGIGCKAVFCDYRKGETSAIVRLDPASPVKAADIGRLFTEKAVKIRAIDVTIATINGKDEDDYWEKIFEKQKAKKTKQKTKH